MIQTEIHGDKMEQSCDHQTSHFNKEKQSPFNMELNMHLGQDWKKPKEDLTEPGFAAGAVVSCQQGEPRDH